MPRGISRHRGAEKQTIIELDARTMAALAADANDYDLSVGGAFSIGATGADRTITGIAGGREQRVIKLDNVLGYNIYLANESSGSLAQNRILTTMNGGGSFQLPPNGSVFLGYNNTVNRWLVLHGTPSAYTPETDPNAQMFRHVSGRRSGGFMTQARALQLLSAAQGPLRLKFGRKISGNTATQAFGPVAGCSVTFTMPAAGDCIVVVSGTMSTGIGQVLKALSIGLRVDGGTAYPLGSESDINGAGGDAVGDAAMCQIDGLSLGAGSHTLDLCWGDGIGNYTLLSNATTPAVIGVLYPG